MHGTAAARFQDLLLRYSQENDPAARALIERTLWQEFGTEQAVLVADMSGFSSLTSRYGIVHYLSMVRRMQLTADPIIHGFGGVILKFEADNAFAMFPDVRAAVRAATALNLAFEAANRLTPDELDITLACGIDFGPILVVDRRDFFGDAVNRASKLGEDLAAPGEILITRHALAQIAGHADLQLVPLELEAGGLQIDAVAIRWTPDA